MPNRERPSLQLVATVHSRLGATVHDDLATVDDLARWLDTAGLGPVNAVARKDIAAFVALREAIYRLLGNAPDRSDTDKLAADVELVNKHVRGRAPHTTLRVDTTASGDPSLAGEVEPPTVAQALTAVARDAVDLLTGPDRDRLHQCQAEVCGSFFLDTSRAGQRRWCSSASCGNRLRVAAHRERRRPQKR